MESKGELNSPSHYSFLCYVPDFGTHVTRPYQGLSLSLSLQGMGRRETLGTRLACNVYTWPHSIHFYYNESMPSQTSLFHCQPQQTLVLSFALCGSLMIVLFTDLAIKPDAVEKCNLPHAIGYSLGDCFFFSSELSAFCQISNSSFKNCNNPEKSQHCLPNSPRPSFGRTPISNHWEASIQLRKRLTHIVRE